MGVVAVPSMVAPVLGPVLGGVIVDQLDWRWVFFVNVPVCVVALYVAARGMPASARSEAHRLDVVGLALLSPGLALVVFGLSEAGVNAGFGHATVLVPLLAGVALLIAFGFHALRTRIEPIIDLRLFRSRPFAASAGMMFLFGISLFGGLFLVPLFDQQVRGLSPAEAGLMLAPQGIGMGVMLVVVARFASTAGPRPIAAAGLVLTTVGTLAYTQADASTSGVVLGLSLALRGAGIGAAFVAVMTASYHGLPRTSIPRATSAVRIFQQVGASLGTAVLAVVVSRGAVGAVGLDDLAGAYGNAFWWTVGFTALAAPLILLLPAGQVTDEPSTPSTPSPATDTDTDAATDVVVDDDASRKRETRQHVPQ
jgi:EmrB/QacA subfamily drug resistance transporter